MSIDNEKKLKKYTRLSESVKKIEYFFSDFYYSTLALFKIIIQSKFNLLLPSAEATDIVILGNGPSLRKTLDRYGEELKKKKLFCVNNFATTKEFQEYKPSYYVLLDPGYFIQKQRTDIIATFDELKNVSWPLNLFIPYIYKRDSDIIELIENNKFVQVYFYNYTVVKGFKFFTYFLYRKNLCMPQLYNVLGGAILLALNMGYKKVWIAGADHSWFKDIHVNQSNTLLLSQPHFYENEPAISKPLMNHFQEKTSIGYFFNVMYRVFNSYYILNDYAIYMSSKIYNISECSFIDAFEKKIPSDLLNNA